MGAIEPLEYDESNQKRCSECNESVPEASYYCPYCGIPLKVVNSAPIQDMEPVKPEVTVKKRKKKKINNKTKRHILFCALVVLTLAIFVFGYVKFNEGKIQIPFDAASAVGKEADQIYKELEEAGFKKVTKKKDESGWMKDGRVIRVTIGDTDSFSKGSYKNPDEDIVIYYSSEGRIDATDIFKDWQNTEFQILWQKLEEAGFTNVSAEESVTYEMEKNLLTSAIILDGEEYTEGKCFLPSNMPITISCNVLKIEIGTKSSKFVGKYYKDVVTDLQARGFINIELRRADNLKIGLLKKEGTVSSLSIDGKTDFKKNDSFYYYSQVVIVVNTYEGEGCDDITVIAY